MKPKIPKPPPIQPPAPLPTEAPEAEETEMKKLRKRQGYERTLITGSLTPRTGKKTVLG